MLQSDAEQLLKDILKTAVSNRQFGQHILLCGAVGLVKRTLWTAVSQFKGIYLINIAASTLKNAGDTAAYLTHLRPGDFLIINDLHRLSKPSGELLAQVLHDFVLHIEVGRGSDMKHVALHLPDFTLIGATSKPDLVPDALKQSIRHQIWIDNDSDSHSPSEIVMY